MKSESLVKIRDVLQSYMKQHEMNYARFSSLSGVNQGTISRIIQGKTPISFRQLEAITRAMELPADSLFESYIEECFAFPTSVRRIRPFLIRCAELGRLDCIERVVSRLLDDLFYKATLFEIGEELFFNNYRQAAALLYEHVSESEKFQHSERLALCKYRLFQITLGNNLEANLQAAIVFEPYIQRLDDSYQLDALKQVIDVMVTAMKWKKVDELAVEMLEIAKIQYHRPPEGKPKHPIYFYVMYAWLIRSTVCEEQQDYNGALRYVAYYADSSWIKEQDDEALRYIQQFKEWATANTYLYRLLSGEAEALKLYVDYVSSRPNEIMLALGYIVKAALKFKYDIDEILKRFSAYLPIPLVSGNSGGYNQVIMNVKCVQLLIDLGRYYFNKNSELSIKLILEGMELAININSVENIIYSMTLFEQYRESASLEAKERFKKLSSEVNKAYEEESVVLNFN